MVDAAGKTLGRLSSEISVLLMGKHKPIYVPHLNTGDYVVVVNAEKIRVTGNKLEQKMYYRHSGYHGGLTERTLSQMLEKTPTRVITQSVKGMLPKNALGRHMPRPHEGLCRPRPSAPGAARFQRSRHNEPGGGFLSDYDAAAVLLPPRAGASPPSRRSACTWRTGPVIVNGKPIEEAFPWDNWRREIMEPFRITHSGGQFRVVAKVTGGGVTGQAGALRHGISRALIEADPSLRTPLKRAGMLTRDPRVKERRKYGLKKARKAQQYTKR